MVGVNEFACGGIPNLYGCIGAATGNHRAIMRPGDSVYFRAMTMVDKGISTSRCIPDLSCGVSTGRGDAAAIG